MNKVLTSVRTAQAALGTAVLVASISAHAALPVAASDAITAMGTKITETMDAFWAPIVLAVGGFLLFKLFRRGVGKL